MRTGDRVMVAPELTGQSRWIDGEVINVRKNPFVGTEIAIKDKTGTIFFGPEIYFSLTNSQSVCSQ
jgi:hypothetical protein